MRFVVRKYDSVPTEAGNGQPTSLVVTPYTDKQKQPQQRPQHVDDKDETPGRHLVNGGQWESPAAAAGEDTEVTMDTEQADEAKTVIKRDSLCKHEQPRQQQQDRGCKQSSSAIEVATGEEIEDQDKDSLYLAASSNSSLGTSSPTASTLDENPYRIPMARRGRIFAKRQRHRLVSKDGECNVSTTKVSTRKRKYLVDLFTTLMDMKWRYTLLMFFMAFVTTWLSFAVLWWAICILHKDHLHKDEDNWQPCMNNVYDFTTAFLFSLETQHTIGYGFRVMEPKCPEAVFLLMCQSCIGVFIQSLMTGVIFAKLSRPKRRAQTILFSKHAVICLRDGKPRLLFRVGDMRRSHIVSTTIRAMLVQNRMTKEGELLPLCQANMELESETRLPDKYVFMCWPVTMVHTINKDSPLWDTSAEQLLGEHFEIVVILEGTVESTGMTTQVRTSYLPAEIFWGHRLMPLVTYQKDNGEYKIDYSQFHNTVPVSMPECSAKTLYERRNQADNGDDYSEEDYPLTFTSVAPSRPSMLLPKKTGFTFKRKGREAEGVRSTAFLNGLIRSGGRSSTARRGNNNKKKMHDSRV